MTWNCKHDINGFCEKRKKLCAPDSKGCVLHKRFKFVEINNPKSMPTAQKATKTQIDLTDET